MRKKFSSSKFNELVAKLEKTQVYGSEIKEPDVRHPFFVSTTWAQHDPNNPTQGVCLVRIEPGFCNSKDCNIIAPAKYCTTETLDRIEQQTKKRPKPEERVEALLSELPQTPAVWRHVNPEGNLSSFGAKYEKIPDALLKLGARGNPESQNKFVDGKKELYACDIWIHHERWYSEVDVSISDPFATASLVNFDIMIKEVPQAARRAEIRMGGPFAPSSTARSLLEVLLGVRAEAWDALFVAKLWALSPSPESDNWTEEPSAGYQVLVEQKLYWGLRYLPPEIPPIKKFQPIKMGTGLLNGIADQIFNSMLTFVNDATNAAANILASLENRKGKFFTI